MNDIISPLLTRADAASVLKVTTRTVGEFMSRRGLKFVRLSGNRVRIRPEQLEEFIREREVPSPMTAAGPDR
jgi:excisionase family DNA binding protein